MALGLPDLERAIGLPCVSAAGKLSNPKSRPRFIVLSGTLVIRDRPHYTFLV